MSKSSKEIPSLSLRDFVDPKRPWVLVPNGSLGGFFDWVPKRLRIGPWSPLALLYLVVICSGMIYTMPHHSSILQFDDNLIAFPDAYSKSWWYNVIGFLWMSGVLLDCVNGKIGPGVLCTYTVQSWTIITVRHGLSALAPFLSRGHVLVALHEMTRFTAIATATITFVVWNLAILPVLYFVAMDTPKKKRDFLTWSFSFRLSQLHIFNILFAVGNVAVSSPRVFGFVDFWCAYAAGVGYTLLYLFVLDRVGVHLYPIFSPRTGWSALTWTGVLGCYYGTYLLWNSIIADGTLSRLMT